MYIYSHLVQHSSFITLKVCIRFPLCYLKTEELTQYQQEILIIVYKICNFVVSSIAGTCWTVA
jgi:hypothetical protein